MLKWREGVGNMSISHTVLDFQQGLRDLFHGQILPGFSHNSLCGLPLIVLSCISEAESPNWWWLGLCVGGISFAVYPLKWAGLRHETPGLKMSPTLLVKHRQLSLEPQTKHQLLLRNDAGRGTVTLSLLCPQPAASSSVRS